MCANVHAFNSKVQDIWLTPIKTDEAHICLIYSYRRNTADIVAKIYITIHYHIDLNILYRPHYPLIPLMI